MPRKKHCIILFIIYIVIQVYVYDNKNANQKAHASHVAVEKDKRKSFCVIASLFNPASYKSRYETYRKFEAHIRSFGVQLITVELAFDNQTFQITSKNNSRHIQLRTDDVLWYKENLINIGMRRSPPECEYIAWIDAELEFLNAKWVDDAIQKLQKYKIVQLFDVIRMLGPKSEIIEARFGYAKCFPKKKDDNASKFLYKKLNIPWVDREKHFCATGFAWAAKKKTLLDIGGLFDKGIAGSGDSIMAFGLMNEIREKTVPFVGDFLKEIRRWQEVVSKYMNRSITYLANTSVNHLWHGSMKNRAYVSRNAIVNSPDFPYRPQKHLYYDEQGLLHFKLEAKQYFKNRLLEYFVSRNEDLDG